MNEMTEPLPCPFCDSEAAWIAARQREDGTYYPAACGCRKCGIWFYGESDYGHGGFATEDDRKLSMKQAVSKWNTRMGVGECKIIGSSTNNLMYMDYMTKWYELSCGHSVTLKGTEPPRFCPNCGKVVKR